MATVRERIDADLKDAMRSKNELNTSVLRMLKSAIKYKEVEPGATGPLDEPAILQVIGGWGARVHMKRRHRLTPVRHRAIGICSGHLVERAVRFVVPERMNQRDAAIEVRGDLRAA